MGEHRQPHPSAVPAFPSFSARTQDPWSRGACRKLLGALSRAGFTLLLVPLVSQKLVTKDFPVPRQRKILSLWRSEVQKVVKKIT